MNGAAHKLIYHGKLNSVCGLYRACTHPLRLKLLMYIHEHGKINVNNIYHTLKLKQSVTSQHLKILRDARLVNTVRDGKFIYYSVNYKLLAQLMGATEKYF
jgi:ArsR family transcriptional regulator